MDDELSLRDIEVILTALQLAEVESQYYGFKELEIEFSTLSYKIKQLKDFKFK